MIAEIIDNFHKSPANWIPVEGLNVFDLPEPGVYVVLSNEYDSSLVVKMAILGEYDTEFESGFGWYEWIYDETVPLKVVAYLPQNYDLDALKKVRQYFKGKHD